ncbi:hypothetical protein Nepgr_018854 [Nepenthes gracilis]|uniref:Uncharacterized protein n=1 Tax=Nepenthes gracilis TaxID=150966 RepID=A0AAD3SS37_NEPGR|nr:hypothetical protein Nepgr_018854 [Nepenthes gracilis]
MREGEEMLQSGVKGCEFRIRGVCLPRESTLSTEVFEEEIQCEAIPKVIQTIEDAGKEITGKISFEGLTLYMGEGWYYDFQHNLSDAFSPPDFYASITSMI